MQIATDGWANDSKLRNKNNCNYCDQAFNSSLSTIRPDYNVGFIFSEDLKLEDDIHELCCIRLNFDSKTAVVIITFIVQSKRVCCNSLYYNLPFGCVTKSAKTK